MKQNNQTFTFVRFNGVHAEEYLHKMGIGPGFQFRPALNLKEFNLFIWLFYGMKWHLAHIRLTTQCYFHQIIETKLRGKNKFGVWVCCSNSIWEDFFSGSFLLLSLSEAIKAAGSTFMQQKTRQIFRPIFCLLDKASTKPLMTDPAIICQSDPQCYD